MRYLISSWELSIYSATLHHEQVKSGWNTSRNEVFESSHLPHIPDMPIAGSGHGNRVTFRSLAMTIGLMSSTPHLVPQPVSFNLSEIPDTETSGKGTDSEVEGMPNMGTSSDLTPHSWKMRRAKQDASIVMHSLQLVAEEFKKKSMNQ